MKVAIVGSFRKSACGSVPRPAETKAFASACEAVGRKLAESGHVLIVPHPEDADAAEHHVLTGFRRVAQSRYIKSIEHPSDPVLKAHLDAVENADAVILVGGRNGTYASGLAALRRRKLIVPVPAFGGAARDLCQIPEIDKSLSVAIRNLHVGGRVGFRI